MKAEEGMPMWLTSFSPKSLTRHRNYLAISLGNTIITYLVYVGMLFALPPTYAYAISYIVGIFFSFLANARLVFETINLKAIIFIFYAANHLFCFLLSVKLYIFFSNLDIVDIWLTPFVVVVCIYPYSYLANAYIFRITVSP